jgi:hypothetical protein
MADAERLGKFVYGNDSVVWQLTVRLRPLFPIWHLI